MTSRQPEGDAMFPSYLQTPRDAAELSRLARTAPGPLIYGCLPYDERPVAVAFYPATNADGGDVTVTVLRLPAMFYVIHCPAKGIHLGAGSGEDLVHARPSPHLAGNCPHRRRNQASRRWRRTRPHRPATRQGTRRPRP
jgi:hypothetical protein